MTKPSSGNPKLTDWVAQQRQNLAQWVPSEQQIQIITSARELLDLVPEELGDSTNAFTINALNVMCHLHPEVTDPQQLVDDTFKFITETASFLSCAKRKGGN